jgi:hypothetical protein
VAGLFLYKTNILNISKPSDGSRYGLLVGVIVYLVRAIPVGQFILIPEFGRALSSLSSSSSNITTNNFHKNNNNDIIINKERQNQQYANLTFSNPQLNV